MYLNNTTCQLYPIERENVFYAHLVSTFRLANASRFVLSVRVCGIHHDVKRLALQVIDCQKWRNSHFPPLSKALNDGVTDLVTIGGYG
jgi:hypothetical protein